MGVDGKAGGGSWLPHQAVSAASAAHVLPRRWCSLFCALCSVFGVRCSVPSSRTRAGGERSATRVGGRRDGLHDKVPAAESVSSQGQCQPGAEPGLRLPRDRVFQCRSKHGRCNDHAPNRMHACILYWPHPLELVAARGPPSLGRAKICTPPACRFSFLLRMVSNASPQPSSTHASLTGLGRAATSRRPKAAYTPP